MRRLVVAVMAAVVAISVGVLGCGQAAPAPSPTAAPAAPTKAAEPAKASPAPAAAAAAPTAAPAASNKLDYPQKGKTITLLVPYSAGGATDLIARLLASNLEKDLGTSVQVVDKPGAGGQEALIELTGAKPDGYTLAVVALPTTLANYMDPSRNATFSSKNMQMLGRLVAAPLNVAVKADSPYKTIDDLINAAKARPGAIPFGAGTMLSSYHLGALEFERATGVKFAKVFFDGGAGGVTAVLGGHVEATINQAGELLPQVKNGALRVLAVMDSQPNKFFPDVKTLESLGYKGYQSTNNVAIGPAGMPKEIVNLVSTEIKNITATDQFVSKAAEMGLDVRYLDAEQLGKLWADLEAQDGPLILQARQQQQ